MFEARCVDRGYTLDEVRPCIVGEDGDTITVDEKHPAYPRAKQAGKELKAILKDWFGIEATANCSCNFMARKMDSLGPSWCRSADGMAEILGVMRTEHANRKTILPWSDIAARQLVLLACRRAAG